MAQPVHFGRPPLEEEAHLYYYGLPSRPRLIARSGTRMWVNPQMPGPITFLDTQNMYPRVLQPVGRHPQLHQQWNDGSSSLRAQILKAVDGINWTALDILRVGLNGEYTLTLMIAGFPDSLSWSDGHPITIQYKKIFEAHGIRKVECEIRESVVNFCTNVAFGSATDIQEASTTDKTADEASSSEASTPPTRVFLLWYRNLPKALTHYPNNDNIPARRWSGFQTHNPESPFVEKAACGCESAFSAINTCTLAEIISERRQKHGKPLTQYGENFFRRG